jgi:uncharacterized protein (DUF1697 family)
MTGYVALLRAVNVGGHHRVSMSALTGVAADLGFEGVSSLLQSGNLTFRGAKRARRSLETTLERGFTEQIGIHTQVVVRTGPEWSTLLKENPFEEFARTDPGRLHVVVLKDEPSGGAASALQRSIPGREVARVVGDRLYVMYPDGAGRSRVTLPFIEGKLGTTGTGRNWNTARKIGERLVG